MPTEIEAGERRAWGWIAALREGATTPWSDFDGTADRAAATSPAPSSSSCCAG